VSVLRDIPFDLSTQSSVVSTIQQYLTLPNVFQKCHNSSRRDADNPESLSELSPEKPNYDGGSWHVEGQLNEQICASALYYYDCENITESHLAFRQRVKDDEEWQREKTYEQVRNKLDAIDPGEHTPPNIPSS